MSLALSTPEISSQPWNSWQKVLFRFFFIYFVLYVLPFPFTAFVPLEPVEAWTTDLWFWLVDAIAPILGYQEPVNAEITGSGDRTFDYLLDLAFLGMAFLGTVAWSLADRKRLSYPTLFALLTILLRYYLAYEMFTYGYYKVFKLQFALPNLYRLTQTYGESSPMGLAWNFMGASVTYTWFAGAMEVITGALLLFRRTTLLGALVALGVMGNVFMMNMSYDIPVKLFSFHLILVAAFILVPDVRRLLNLLLLNRRAEPRDLSLHLNKKWMRTGRYVLKVAFVGFGVVWPAFQVSSMLKEYGESAPRPPLYGIYEVQSVFLNGDEVPPLATDSSRWKRLIVNYPSSAQVENMRDQKHYFEFEVDTTAQRLHMHAYTDSTDTFEGRYLRTDSTGLVFQGRRGEDSLVISMRRFDEKRFLLLNRGFHWVSEVPYRR